MDKELFSYAYLLQAGYTHKELKSLLLDNSSIQALELWENTKKGQLPPLGTQREVKIKDLSQKVNEEKIIRLIQENSVDIVPQFDERYPKYLKTIRHAPAFFYLKGKMQPNIPLLGIVGSRKHTSYGERILEKIVPDIIEMGIGVVSGGATGIDALGHSITLKHHGYTIVVLGTGIDICYPEKNRALFEKVVESGGGIISHFPLSTGPELYNFPIRNEIVAALSKGILIPEAGLSSGTLITAQLALEHGREVFAVPGDIDRKTSEGTNMLIATGQAKCIRNSSDVLEEYFETIRIGDGMNPIVKVPPRFQNEHEKCLYEKIEAGYDCIDLLVRETEIGIEEVQSTVAMLELAGIITLDFMGKYRVL